MRIVGLNSGLDSLMKPISGGSVACVCDGKIEFAMAEDRASRKKYDGGYAHSLRMMYDYLEIGVKDVDFFVISFYGHPLIPRKDILAHHLKDLGLEKIPEKLVVIPSHHLSHAYAAYFLSPFEESLIMIADNEGSLLFSKDAEQKGTHSNYCERNSYYWARGNEIVLIGRDFETPGNAGFGKVYNKFTRYIGFGNYHNAGKTMGLSSYGRFPESWRSVDLWAMDAEGSLQSTLRDTWSTVPDMENFLKNNKMEFSLSQAPDRYLEQAGKDLAQYVQGQLNKWSLRKVGHLLEKTGVKNVCIAGGVGLNGVMNTYIEQKTGQSVFVPPFPSDQGQALGNAIWGSHYLEGVAHRPQLPKRGFSDYVYLGTDYTNEEILSCCEALTGLGIRFSLEKDICETAARLLSENKVLGWFQGRSEYGARALGNRSMLASPHSAQLRDRVNTLKRRELFRPLAPSVLSDRAKEYFNTEESLLDPLMLGVVQAKENRRKKIEGVVHVDNSSRVQCVSSFQNPKYHRLLTAFYELTGIPLVINTSFNKAGEPIVETPEDAVRAAASMNLDALVCNDVLIRFSDKVEANTKGINKQKQYQ